MAGYTPGAKYPGSYSFAFGRLHVFALFSLSFFLLIFAFFSSQILFPFFAFLSHEIMDVFPLKESLCGAMHSGPAS